MNILLSVISQTLIITIRHFLSTDTLHCRRYSTYVGCSVSCPVMWADLRQVTPKRICVIRFQIMKIVEDNWIVSHD